MQKMILYMIVFFVSCLNKIKKNCLFCFLFYKDKEILSLSLFYKIKYFFIFFLS